MDEIQITLVILVIVMLQLLGMVFAFHRFYRRVPPGKIGVRTGHGPGPKIIRTAGIFVIPPLHQFDFVHAEVESLGCNGREILVQVGEDANDVLKARTAFGQKQVDEIRRLLQEMVDSADGAEKVIDAKLAEVGYRRI